MKIIKLFDDVVLKDGRSASVVEILSEDTFIADIKNGDDFETDFISLSDITEVLN